MSDKQDRSLIRETRERHHVGLRELARRCNVAPSTVVNWESSEERGTVQVSTLSRALSALGETLIVSSREEGRPLPIRLDRREQRVSLELHKAVARKLIDDPVTIVGLVSKNLPRLREGVKGPIAFAWLDEWSRLAASSDIGGLIGAMVGTDQRSIDMRQVTPFTGALTQDERLEAIDKAVES